MIGVCSMFCMAFAPSLVGTDKDSEGGGYPPSAARETIIAECPLLPGGVMDSRFRRNFGLSPRSPQRPGSQDAAPPLAAHSEEMILAQRSSRRQRAVGRLVFWLGNARHDRRGRGLSLSRP